jgi:N utilization substance protein B
MNIPQQKFREVVFQLLYSFDLGLSSEEEMIPFLMKELAVTKKVVRNALNKVKLILSHEKDIDALIAKTSISYSFDRIQSVERNVLRLGTYELLFDDSIPPKVAIAEAVRLARKFGTPECAAFINAVLDAIYKSHQGETIDQLQLTESFAALIESEEVAKEAIEKEQKSNLEFEL